MKDRKYEWISQMIFIIRFLQFKQHEFTRDVKKHSILFTMLYCFTVNSER